MASVFSKQMPKQPVTMPKPTMGGSKSKSKAPSPASMKSVRKGCATCGK